MKIEPITINLRKLTDRFIGSLGYVKADEIRRRPTFGPDDLFLGETSPGEENPYGNWTDDKWERLAITSSWVMSDVNLIAQEISGGTFEVQQRDSESTEGWSSVIAHPFEEIIERRPNPDMGQAMAWQFVIKWLMLRGQAYWLLVPDQNGELLQMWPLPASRVRPLPDLTNPLRLFGGFQYWPKRNVEPRVIPPWQICYHRFMNPWDIRDGLSPITAYRIALMSDDKARTLGLDDFENGLTLRSIISLRSDITDIEFDRAKQMIRRGQEAGERYLITPAGEIKVEPLSVSRSDAEFLASREFSRDEIDRVYGIPQGFWSASANRANSEQAVASFREFTVWPLMEMLAEDITVQIIDNYYEPVGMLRGKFRDIRQVNIDRVIKEEDNDRQTQTYNEARAAKGLPDHPDPDVGNAPYGAAAQIAVLKVQQQAAPALPEPDTDQADEEAEDEGEAIADRAEDEAEKARDMRRWESVALRRFRNGHDPAEYDFESGYISSSEAARIKTLLNEVTTESGLKAIFKAQGEPFVPTGANRPLNPIPEIEGVAELIQGEADDYLADFDERFPEYGTLLEVE